MKIKKCNYSTPYNSWSIDFTFGRLSIRKYSFMPMMVWWKNKGIIGGAL